ncbi:caspase family protein [Dyella solisilvae]|uniref:Caspase family protein n=1 Tax=Dyella solisilvae TaxID=1920168 RepID=A0A370K456_9GAMM|nr:caspase family protein [Dyella solisilvae]RDI97441.1 caspase family protein [Dyella solisilvae]
MRSLIAVGCNTYDNLNDLSGAELDAKRVYEALMTQGVGDYDAVTSTLLLSPTLNELRGVLRKILPAGKLDALTFYFAGHGDVHAGSFYICLKDTSLDAISLTAFSLGELFRNLNDFVPSQSNIVIDACRSGGLVSDLGVLLKPDLLGNAGSPGVTLVATSAQDQYASETSAGGVGTNAILDCIEGRVVVNDQRPFLDLAEIGHRIQSILHDPASQQPVVWGLNLFSSSGFCRNPRHGSDPTAHLKTALHAWPATHDHVVREHYNDLWEAYSSVDSKWKPRQFADTISTVLKVLSGQPQELISFFDKLSNAAIERAEKSTDAFRATEVSATLAICLLPFIQEPLARNQMQALLDRSGSATLAACLQLLDDVRDDRYALLSKQGGGLSDLYVLPVRLTKVLAWAAAGSSFLSDSDGKLAIDRAFGDLLRVFIELYTNSLTLVTDAQAPYIAVLAAHAKALQLDIESEQVFGLFYSSLIERQGNLAASDIPPESVLKYLEACRSSNFTSVMDHIERPSQTLAVLFKFAELFGLQDVVDDELWELDRASFLAYITTDYNQYGLRSMDGGNNYVWTIGQDLCRVEELANSWPTVSPPSDELAAQGAVAASLLYPDRVPWFLFSAA